MLKINVTNNDTSRLFLSQTNSWNSFMGGLGQAGSQYLDYLIKNKYF